MSADFDAGYLYHYDLRPDAAHPILVLNVQRAIRQLVTGVNGRTLTTSDARASYFQDLLDSRMRAHLAQAKREITDEHFQASSGYSPGFQIGVTTVPTGTPVKVAWDRPLSLKMDELEALAIARVAKERPWLFPKPDTGPVGSGGGAPRGARSAAAQPTVLRFRTVPTNIQTGRTLNRSSDKADGPEALARIILKNGDFKEAACLRYMEPDERLSRQIVRFCAELGAPLADRIITEDGVPLDRPISVARTIARSVLALDNPDARAFVLGEVIRAITAKTGDSQDVLAWREAAAFAAITKARGGIPAGARHGSGTYSNGGSR